jgi:beta-glucosidase
VRVQVSPWLAAACLLIVGLAAASAGSAAAAAGPPPDRSNVGATHSPQLLRQLAGPPGAAAARAAISRSAIAGAEQGVDVASFQHPSKAAIEWSQVATAGIQFAAVKATEGNYYQNPYALTDLAGARAAGLSVIAYAFAIPNGNGGSKSQSTGHTDLDQLNPALLALLSPGTQQGAQGSPVDLQISQADPVTGQAPSFSATGLPPGTSISSGGLITGWPAAQGTYQATVSASAGGVSGSVSFTWQVTAASQGPAGAVRVVTGGKCLNDVGNKSANGTQADIWTCNGSTAQQWTYVQDGTLRIHGKCLVPPSSSPASGAKVVLATCTGTSVQQWWLTYPRSITSGPATGRARSSGSSSPGPPGPVW